MTSTQLTRRVLPHLGVRKVLLAGLTSVAIGQVWLSTISSAGSYQLNVLGGILLTAFGMGLTFPTASVVITAGVGPGERGLAGGLFVTSQQIGQAIGLAVLATVAAALTTITAPRQRLPGGIPGGHRLRGTRRPDRGHLDACTPFARPRGVTQTAGTLDSMSGPDRHCVVHCAVSSRHHSRWPPHAPSVTAPGVAGTSTLRKEAQMSASRSRGVDAPQGGNKSKPAACPQPPRPSKSCQSSNLTPRLVAIRLGGELDDFEHVAPHPHTSRSTCPMPTARLSPARTPHDAMTERVERLEVVFVIHGPGPASQWAALAKPGDRLAVGGLQAYAFDPTAPALVGRRGRERPAGHRHPARRSTQHRLCRGAREVDGAEDEIALESAARCQIFLGTTVAQP